MLNVLSSVRDGLDKPTRIMYASNLSWNPSQRLFASLVDNGYLRVIQALDNKSSRTRYEITEKGLKVLDYFNGMDEFIHLNEMIQ
jgi:predicted transcriptional regulator